MATHWTAAEVQQAHERLNELATEIAERRVEVDRLVLGLVRAEAVQHLGPALFGPNWSARFSEDA